MNVIDYAILIVVGLSALIGVMRGLVGEVMSMLVWIAAFGLSFLFGDSAAALFSSIDTAAFRMMLGYAGVFGGTMIAGSLLTWLLRTLIHSSGLSGTDRVAGLGFGVVRGFAIVVGIVLLLGFTSLPGNTTWRQSALMPSMESGAVWLKSFLPSVAAAENRLGEAFASIKQSFSMPKFSSLPSLQSISADQSGSSATTQSNWSLPALNDLKLSESLNSKNASFESLLALGKQQFSGISGQSSALPWQSSALPLDTPTQDNDAPASKPRSDEANIDKSPRGDSSYVFPPES